MQDSPEISVFDDATDCEGVVDLWVEVFGYETAHNDPRLVISKKTQVSDELFHVAKSETGKIIGTVMCGYDGHRGWIYSLAVLPEFRRTGIGLALMEAAEKSLVEMGCVKINLQIIEGNEIIQRFYEALGYSTEKRISMGKQIKTNIPRLKRGD